MLSTFQGDDPDMRVVVEQLKGTSQTASLTISSISKSHTYTCVVQSTINPESDQQSAEVSVVMFGKIHFVMALYISYR